MKDFTNKALPPCYSKQELHFGTHTKEDLLTPFQPRRLASTNPKYFGPACRANPLCSWPPILQGNSLGILYIYLPSTLKTIRLQSKSPPSWYRLNYTLIIRKLSRPVKYLFINSREENLLWLPPSFFQIEV